MRHLRLDRLLESMESAARHLQEPTSRFLTPRDYPFLREDRYHGHVTHQTTQQPALYAVK